MCFVYDSNKDLTSSVSQGRKSLFYFEGDVLYELA
ncbi:hypothetical protein DES34_102322 [Brevibacillus brevis]|nr:hypothetical protein DES34_102322 [Brevibacillus brevis]VEF92275.1 Uncharacterised protein [Brevibacillus brevis]